MAKKSANQLRQARFVARYLANGFNATQAAIDAGYSAKTARTQASELLTKANIQEAIKKGVEQALKDIDIDRIRWLNEVKKIAFSDFRKVAKFNGNGVELTDSDEIDDDTAGAIESIESTVSYDKLGNEIVNRKVKLHSKTKGLDTLGKFLGMLKEEQAAGVTIIINDEETKLG